MYVCNANTFESNRKRLVDEAHYESPHNISLQNNSTLEETKWIFP